jgi:hypothetical protein
MPIQQTRSRPRTRSALTIGGFRHLLLGVVVVIGAVLGTPASAQATPFPETWLADNGAHAYCFTSTFDNFAANRAPVTWAMNRLDAQTDMSDIPEACATGTDIWFYRIDLPAGIRGQAQCTRFNDNGRCATADVRMDFPELNIGDNDLQDQQKTAVHEIGHTVGLGHHSPAAHDCAMVSGEVPSTALKWRSFHAHDVTHINQTY